MSFRREKCVEFGGPDGGNGGRGGHVLIEAVGGLNTLIDFRYRQHFKGGRGGHGMGKNRTGRKGNDIYLKVPVGTQIFDEEYGVMLADLTEEGQVVMMLEGGHPGTGNAAFKSSVNQAPRRTTPGGPAEEMWIWLRLKLMADAGLVGLPNAGKSTFVSAVSRAKPKIADYPFTTLKPQLGVVYVDQREFVIADIPGLIEGAHEGHGLGDRFLGHIERCNTILHMIDATGEDIVEAYKTIRHELDSYGGGLSEKPEVIGLNKCDCLDEELISMLSEELRAVTTSPIIPISAATRFGVDDMLRALLKNIDQANEMEKSHYTPPAYDDFEQEGEDKPVENTQGGGWSPL